MKSIIKKLASLKLAVLVLVLVAVLTAVGTFIEARYDAMAASKWVYRTWWMYGVFVLLAINLSAVMADRWPWKRRHLSFLLAHIGILILLLGAVVTAQFGLDGSLRVAIGESNRFVAGPETRLAVWSSFDGESYTKLYDEAVDFFLDRPEDRPRTILTDAGEIKITEYQPYMLVSRRFRRSQDARAGSALQFQIQNARVNVNEWLFQSRPGEEVTHNFGPAEIHLGPAPKQSEGKNEIFLEPEGGGERYRYTVFSRASRAPLVGVVGIGDVVKTGWMGLELKILQFYPKAELDWDFRSVDRPSPLTNAALRLEFQGKQHWLQLDDVLKVFSEKAVYIVTYGHSRIDIGFDLFLKNFEIGRYPGTMRAAKYQSRVSAPGLPETIISMNEPLKYQGLTIYQASFQDGPAGAPIASIFSVNRDPGRWLKYLGSLILSIGVVVLFYDRRKAARSTLAPKKWEE